MPLADILRKIEETAQQESARILAEAEQKGRTVLGEAKEHAAQRSQQVLGEARSQAERANSLAKTRSDALKRQMVLKEKQAALDAVFSEALDRLAALPPAEYQGIILQALKNSAKGNETIILGAEDRQRLGPEFRETANAAVGLTGESAGFTVQYADGTLGGGFILVSGGVSLNVTFPALVKKLRDEMEIEVARILFA